MNLIAFVTSFGSFKIALRFIRPPLPNTLLRTSLYVRHLSRMWSTVCRPSPQAQPGSSTSGTPRFHRKSLSPIFSVRIWMSRALCHFFKPWCSHRTLRHGCGWRRIYLSNAKYKEGCGVLLPMLEPLQHLSHSMLDQVVMLLLRGFQWTRPSPYVSSAACSLSLPRITTQLDSNTLL